MSVNIVPLSPTARFLATQIGSKRVHPNILLPKHLIKPFLTSESAITYINSISSPNSFQRKQKFSASTTKYLEYLSRIGDDPSTSLSRRSSQFSVILPASQLNPIFKSELIQFIPPPNSDIILLNPHFGQVEKYIEFISNSISSFVTLPRFWCIISTHSLLNDSNWGVKHQSIGEFKISPIRIPSLSTDESDIELVNKSEIIRMILNTSTLIPQFQTSLQSNLLLVEQLIIEAALCPLIHTLKYNIENTNMQLNKPMRTLIRKIIDESVKILKNHNAFNTLKYESPAVNAVLSNERLFKMIIDLLNTNKFMNVYRLNASCSDPNNTFTNKKVIIKKDPNDDETDIILPTRNQSRANTYIFKLGLQYGIDAPINKHVCDVLDIEKSSQNHKSTVYNI